ncbi:ArsC family transcriptional regulator [Methanomassiliicoccales archaeon RumEn M1]|nr:ArsC family transcriptional regulator [Methanomassiliicoccales archaeon RumEn M1]
MARQDIDAPGPKKRVLFICTHNAARSQMAEALLKNKYGSRYEVGSAGSRPGKLDPLAVKVLQEIGIDISQNKPKSVDDFVRPGTEYDYVVTVCDAAAQECPFLPAVHQVHKPFNDPSRFYGTEEEQLNNMRSLRDQISDWIDDFFR